MALKKANDWSTEETAFYSNQKGNDRKYTKKFKGMCSVCGKQGHKGADCWEKEENKDKRPKNWQKRNNRPGSNNKTSTFNGKCWNCGQTGHSQKNCPKKTENANQAQEKVQDNDDSNDVSLLTIEHQEQAQLTYDTVTNDMWIEDSGATSHMTNDPTYMYNLSEVEGSVTIGNGSTIPIKSRGDLDITIIQKDGTRLKCTLKDVKYVPMLGQNLFSRNKLIQKGWTTRTIHKERGTEFEYSLKDKPLFRVDRKFKCGSSVLFGIKVQRRSHMENSETALLNKRNDIDRRKWHELLGHCHAEMGERTAKYYDVQLSGKMTKCENCLIEKIRKSNISKESAEKSTKPGFRISVDLMPMKNKTVAGNTIWLLIVDQATNYARSFF
jgi:Zinc knuckle